MSAFCMMKVAALLVGLVLWDLKLAEGRVLSARSAVSAASAASAACALARTKQACPALVACTPSQQLYRDSCGCFRCKAAPPGDGGNHSGNHSGDRVNRVDRVDGLTQLDEALRGALPGALNYARRQVVGRSAAALRQEDSDLVDVIVFLLLVDLLRDLQTRHSAYFRPQPSYLYYYPSPRPMPTPMPTPTPTPAYFQRPSVAAYYYPTPTQESTPELASPALNSVTVVTENYVKVNGV